ncbi:class I SAM-dependent methyltransferase [Streptococcus caviae]|uniref:class I SAM-dependent methyltransferase n=1 Tax=Streptococcus sp. 'caviae' TaxID=1915004 RepID=UPI00094BAFEF|nr:class I SAM-dependent methyltransferase [Streptococcus sp. 'caviae']OLN83570.1 methyltransferase [Streptococcus sp. 'caviae']
MAENYFEDNRVNWNDRARLHQESGYGINELLEDETYITPEVAQDKELIGDLTGKAVVHLQCHLGTDTVSLARLGVERLVGLDLSDESLKRAKELAEKAKADIEFIEANVYDAREAIEGDFDLVYTSLGVLCWLPDIAAWGRVVASLLKPGGRFIIRDDHPMFMTLGEDISQGFKIEQPYFEQAEPMTWEDEGSYIEAAASSEKIQHPRNHQWNHALSEIIMALIEAGLQIDVVDESKQSSWNIWPDLMEKRSGAYVLKEDSQNLPLQFLIAAHKPKG